MAEPPPTPSRRTFRPQRLAAIAIGGLFLAPGYFSFEMAATPPAGDSCFEYCNFGQMLAPWVFGVALLGLLLAIGIWRSHVSAYIAGLFVCVGVVLVVASTVTSNTANLDAGGRDVMSVVGIVCGVGALMLMFALQDCVTTA